MIKGMICLSECSLLIGIVVFHASFDNISQQSINKQHTTQSYKNYRVSLQPNADLNEVTHTNRILSSSTQSDCETCFSSSEVTTLPVATYTPETLGRRHRCAAVGMVIGPSVLKSGAMSTELVLRHGDGRVRVTFQHAPVWERGVEPGSCPPQGLKLFRTVVSKEKLRPITAEDTEGTIQGPPTAEEEKSNPPQPGNPKFFRPVPPFFWHAKWFR